MKRRHFVLGAAVAAVAGGWWLRPSDRGGPYSEYFRSLNDELKAHGPMRPVMLIDLDRGIQTSTMSCARLEFRQAAILTQC